MKRWGLIVATLLVAMATSNVAFAQVNANNLEELEGRGDNPFPVNVTAGVRGTFGAASVISDSEFTQTDFFLLSSNIGLVYQATSKLNLSLGTGWSQFLSRYGGTNRQFDGRPQDTNLSANFFPAFRDETTGIIGTGGVSVTLPTSDFSRAAGLYTNVGANFTFIRSFGNLNFTYTIGGSKNFHEATSQILDADELDVLARDGGTEVIERGKVAIGGVLTEYSIFNAFGLNYRFPAGFNVNAGLTYADSWTYDNGTITERDEFTNPNAVVGRGHSQFVSGRFGGGYTIYSGEYGFLMSTLNVSTGGQPLTNDQKGIRFPFWDFENAQVSRTRVTIGLSGRL